MVKVLATSVVESVKKMVVLETCSMVVGVVGWYLSVYSLWVVGVCYQTSVSDMMESDMMETVSSDMMGTVSFDMMETVSWVIGSPLAFDIVKMKPVD